MLGKNTQRILIGLAAAGVGAGVYVCTLGCDQQGLAGTWNCKTAWSYEDKEGATVPCASDQTAECVDNKLLSTGVVSIGDAQWDETSEATCYGSSDALYGTRTSVTTVAKNDAARQFEKDILEGKTLSALASKGEGYRVRITSQTDTDLIGSDEKGRTITCRRL